VPWRPDTYCVTAPIAHAGNENALNIDGKAKPNDLDYELAE